MSSQRRVVSRLRRPPRQHPRCHDLGRLAGIRTSLHGLGIVGLLATVYALACVDLWILIAGYRRNRPRIDRG
jgi:hypothetical protein